MTHHDVPGWRQRMLALAERKHCAHCFISETPEEPPLEAHHIIFRRDGGPHDVENLIYLCHEHHVAVHRRELLLYGETYVERELVDEIR